MTGLCPDIFVLRFGPCVQIKEEELTDVCSVSTFLLYPYMSTTVLLIDLTQSGRSATCTDSVTVMQITTEAHSAAQPEGRVS